jgi:uncharacterized protein (UPF0261 family)
MFTVVLVGTLDSKGPEYAFLRDRLVSRGVKVTLVDAGVRDGACVIADIGADEVARAAGSDLPTVRQLGQRREMIDVMARGAAVMARRLQADGQLDAIVAVGGSGGAAIGSAAMRELPFGIPKLLVTTMASADTRPYVGGSDVALIYPVTDIAGLNRVTRSVLNRAAGAVVGMLEAAADPSDDEGRPIVAASMFGVTTPGVDAARARLDELGYEVLVFHANGAGGEGMESLIRAGRIDAVLDLTTTELADELVGGVASAGPRRLDAAAQAGIPQVVSVGALDIVNFGAPSTLPERFRGRLTYEHNPAATLMRTDMDECRDLGRRLAEKVNRSVGPAAVVVPTRGFSALDRSGGPFEDVAADTALVTELEGALEPRVPLLRLDHHVNDEAFGRAAADLLHDLLDASQETAT